MGTLFLVRHGQASFGTHDYDRLSELGARQCRALGAYLRRRGVEFEAVLVGTLNRHVQSLAAIAEGYGELPAPLSRAGLDEYDGEAIVRAHRPEGLPAVGTPEGYRAHFRALREGLVRWAAGELAPPGMPTHVEWLQGITDALDHVRSGYRDDVLLVSSGGPIAHAVAHVLAAGPQAAIELNMRIRNSALTEFVYTPDRHRLLSFNHVAHLDDPERAAWITFA